MSLSKNPKLIAVAKELCRDLRKHSTEAESIFWGIVRDRRFLNKKFYRQYPLFFDFYGKETFFIADFYCYTNSLVVEIDGAYHLRQKDYDTYRTFVINDLGMNVLRFTNDQIKNDIDTVKVKLNKYFQKF